MSTEKMDSIDWRLWFSEEAWNLWQSANLFLAIEPNENALQWWHSKKSTAMVPGSNLNHFEWRECVRMIIEALLKHSEDIAYQSVYIGPEVARDESFTQKCKKLISPRKAALWAISFANAEEFKVFNSSARAFYLDDLGFDDDSKLVNWNTKRIMSADSWTLGEAADYLSGNYDIRSNMGGYSRFRLSSARNDIKYFLERAILARKVKSYARGNDYYVDPKSTVRWAFSKSMIKCRELLLIAQSYEDKVEKPTPPNKVCKFACQAVALALWDIYPNMTNSEMQKHKAILLYAGGKDYQGKNTIKDWLSEVDPRPPEKKRGPRKKKYP